MTLVQCQGCHGSGGEVDRILPDGSGPFEPCGYCGGTGQTTRVMNGWIMRWVTDSYFIPSWNSERKHMRRLRTV